MGELEAAVIGSVIVGAMAWVAIGLAAYISLRERLTRIETELGLLRELLSSERSAPGP